MYSVSLRSASAWRVYLVLRKLTRPQFAILSAPAWRVYLVLEKPTRPRFAILSARPRGAQEGVALTEAPAFKARQPGPFYSIFFANLVWLKVT